MVFLCTYFLPFQPYISLSHISTLWVLFAHPSGMFAFGRTLAIFSCGNLSDATLCLSVFSIPESGSNGARGVLIIEQPKEHQHLGKSKGEKGGMELALFLCGYGIEERAVLANNKPWKSTVHVHVHGIAT